MFSSYMRSKQHTCQYKFLFIVFVNLVGSDQNLDLEAQMIPEIWFLS